jgi:hypothetical protein
MMYRYGLTHAQTSILKTFSQPIRQGKEDEKITTEPRANPSSTGQQLPRNSKQTQQRSPAQTLNLLPAQRLRGSPGKGKNDAGAGWMGR